MIYKLIIESGNRSFTKEVTNFLKNGFKHCVGQPSQGSRNSFIILLEKNDDKKKVI